jgi:hypothetical protein
MLSCGLGFGALFQPSKHNNISPETGQMAIISLDNIVSNTLVGYFFQTLNIECNSSLGFGAGNYHLIHCDVAPEPYLPTNLITSCPLCNQQKGIMDLLYWLFQLFTGNKGTG